MKLAAHPLIVAVALGLLDAGALAALDDTPSVASRASCADSRSTAGDSTDAALEDAADSDLDALISELRTVIS